MPDYKKKKRGSIFGAPKKVQRQRIQKPATDEKIKMSSAKDSYKTEANVRKIRIIEGKRSQEKRRIKTLLPIVSVLLVAVIVLQLCLPAGLVNTVYKGVNLLGRGSYPIELSGDNVLNTVSRGSYYYVLTDTYVTAYNNAGKEMLSYNHCFENPVLKVSAAYAAVYDQGGNEVLIFDIKNLKHSIVTEKEVLTVGISDRGNFAVATRSDSYTAEVTVYNKNAEVIYQWFSAEDIVNNIVLSKNGKKMAVTAFNSNAGYYVSKLYVLNFKSATPEYSETYEEELIYTLDSTNQNGFMMVLKNRIKYIKWKNYASKEYSNEYDIASFSANRGNFIAVFNRESDRTDNRVVLFKSSGELISEFNWSGNISNIKVRHGRIYCISERRAYLLSKKGDILRWSDLDSDAEFLGFIGTNDVSYVTDYEIIKITLEQEN